MEAFVTFYFDAAHRLTQVPSDHKCRQLHGHTFKAEIYISDSLDPDKQWVMDFAEIKAVCQPVIDRLDHTYLNEVEGLENPTSEVIAEWIWQRVKPELPVLIKVIVQESPESGAVYTGD